MLYNVISNHIFYKYLFSLTNFKSPSCDTNVVNYELVNFSEMTMSLKKTFKFHKRHLNSSNEKTKLRKGVNSTDHHS